MFTFSPKDFKDIFIFMSPVIIPVQQADVSFASSAMKRQLLERPSLGTAHPLEPKLITFQKQLADIDQRVN